MATWEVTIVCRWRNESSEAGRESGRLQCLGVWITGTFAQSLFSVSRHPQFFDRSSTGFPQGDKLAALVILRWTLILAAFAMPAAVEAQAPASRVLFRVFLSDGRVLASYGEWTRVDDRVIFSIPTRLSGDPVELHLVNIPSARVDWPRTELYAESVRAVAYAATRGEADFARFSSEMAKTLNEVSRIADPGVRLATAERARQSLAEWPASHYGYRIGEVRQSLDVLDEIISQLRVAVGQTRFDLALSAPLAVPPPPPLPPPTDAELVEQLVAAASIAESPAERITLLQSVMRLLDRAVGLLPDAWARRVRGTVGVDLEHERQAERAYTVLRQRTLETSARLARQGDRREFEKLREQVMAEDRRLGGARAGEISALLATIDLQANGAAPARKARKEWEKREQLYRRYRRSMNGSFNVFRDAAVSLDQVRTLAGPPLHTLEATAKRLASAGVRTGKVTPPADLANGHALVRSAWELAETALRLRRESVSSNSIDSAQRASSAAAGALMLYQRARADLAAAMAPPAAK
ncbi:MAG: hypothetical protein RJA55_565 [Acidobacteriota bacterium]